MERLDQTSSFSEKLAFGQIGESLIALWLRKQGFTLLPAYEKEIDTMKGPRLFGPQDQLIAPDFLGLKGDKIKWFEAKHKTVFTWYRAGQCWETGIDLRHYTDYCTIADRFPHEIWLLFLHTQGRVESPPNKEDLYHYPCPTGLFTVNLKNKEHSHIWEKEHGYGKGGGMIYWKVSQLIKLSELTAIQETL